MNKSDLQNSSQGSRHDCSIKNPNKGAVGNLNTNSVSAKIEQFKFLITRKLDLPGKSFSFSQFRINLFLHTHWIEIERLVKFL